MGIKQTANVDIKSANEVSCEKERNIMVINEHDFFTEFDG